MVFRPKVVSVLSYGFLLSLGMSSALEAADMKAGQSEGNGGQADQKEMIVEMQSIHIVQGDVVRVEGTNYVVKRLDGSEVSLHADNNTMKTDNITAGNRIEAKVNKQNTALSIFPAP